MLGAIIGDIVGSVYEFNNYRAKDFQPLFSRKAFFTDDSVCTCAVADALINHRHPAHALKVGEALLGEWWLGQIIRPLAQFRHP